MGDLTPNTREEYFLARMAGEDVTMPEPITREEEYMKGIADAISGQNDINIPAPITREEIYAEQIVKNLEEITLDLEEKSITENGEYTAAADNKDGFSKVTVNVPNTYTNEDEGKVVSSGALVSQSARSESITENGTYDTTMNNSVTVDIASGGNVYRPASDDNKRCDLVNSLANLEIPEGYDGVSGDSQANAGIYLDSLTLPTTYAGDDSEAPFEYLNITDLYFKEGYTGDIGENILYGISRLDNLHIPSTVTTIADNTFNSASFSGANTTVYINKPEGSITGYPWGASEGAEPNVIWGRYE